MPRKTAAPFNQTHSIVDCFPVNNGMSAPAPFTLHLPGRLKSRVTIESSRRRFQDSRIRRTMSRLVKSDTFVLSPCAHKNIIETKNNSPLTRPHSLVLSHLNLNFSNMALALRSPIQSYLVIISSSTSSSLKMFSYIILFSAVE